MQTNGQGNETTKNEQKTQRHHDDSFVSHHDRSPFRTKLSRAGIMR